MCRSQRGSALLLMPAAVLVLLMLASLAIDSAIVFTGQRQLSDAAAAAANDAVTTGIAGKAFYDCAGLQLEQGRVNHAVATSVAGRSSDIVDSVAAVAITSLSDGTPAVSVTLRGTVERLFAPAFAVGAAQSVQATAIAGARQGRGNPGGESTATCD